MKKHIVLALAMVAGLSFAAQVQAQDFPARKPGLWEVVMESAARPGGFSTRLCLDSSVDKKMMERGLTMSRPGVQCSQRDIKATASKVTVDSVCSDGARTTTTHAETIFQGNSAYRTVAKVKYAPALNGNAESTVSQNAKWLSACPADWRPGDMETPMGGRININEMRGPAGAPGGPAGMRPLVKP